MTLHRDDGLATAVARTAWRDLLPAHRAVGDDQAAGAPLLQDALELADGVVLAVVRDTADRSYAVPLVVGPHGVRRAVPGDGAAEALIGLVRRGTDTTGLFRVDHWHDEPATGESGFAVDQTNESVVVGEKAVVKWTVHAEPGPHPAPGMLELLAASDFRGVPRPWGLVQWRPEPTAPYRLLASVDALVPDATDGWTWAVEDLHRAVLEARPDLVQESGAHLGALVAGFHTALAGTAVPAIQEDVAAWETLALAALTDALGATPTSAALLADQGKVREALRLPSDLVGVPVIRVHGDLHVGQVLRSSGRYVLTDLDGNPVVPPQERTRPWPAAFDVAGLLQSVAHAGIVLAHRHPELPIGDVAAATQRFEAATLAAYGEALTESGHAGLLEPRLLRPFRLAQVCREVTYAATHLPRWAYVPEAALPALLSRPVEAS